MNHLMSKIRLWVLIMTLATACIRPEQPTPTPLLGNLGDHTHPITAQSEMAQKYFDQRLMLTC